MNYLEFKIKWMKTLIITNKLIKIDEKLESKEGSEHFCN